MPERKPVFVRNMDADVWAKIKRGAGSRDLEVGPYIVKLQQVHDLARRFAAGEIGAADFRKALDQLGMGTQTT